MKVFLLAVVLSVVAEGLVSYGESIYDYFAKGDIKKAIKQICAIVIAIVFAFEAKVMLISFFAGVSLSPVFDMVISGIFMSRGSNYLYDFYNLIRRVGKDEFELIDEDELLDEFDEDYDEDQTQLLEDDLAEYEEGDK